MTLNGRQCRTSANRLSPTKIRMEELMVGLQLFTLFDEKKATNLGRIIFSCGDR